MRKQLTYTQEEISSKINILKTQELDLLQQIKDLNKRIKEKRDNIKYYKELDLSQLKSF